MLEIFPISVLQDNYVWVITNPSNHNTHAIVIDPSIASPIINVLAEKKLTLAGILITHHHADHTGGIAGLLQYKNVPVHGPDKTTIMGITHAYREGDILPLTALEINCKVLAIPGHTLDHIAFLTEQQTPAQAMQQTQPKQAAKLFCGDTVFMAGCGRLFEGTPQQMLHSINKIKSLPPNTLLYCAHEYTEQNLMFALTVEPNNQQLQQRLADTRRLRKQNLPTVPATLATELATNPFLRSDQATVITAIQQHYNTDTNAEDELFGLLREWKDNFSSAEPNI